MKIYEPYGYQQHAENRIIDTPGVGPFLEMGLGKTVITLSAINRLIYDRAEVCRVLVIAPMRVAAHTWPEELRKWDHLQNLTFTCVLGDVKTRVKALKQKTDIHIINRENVPWLVAYLGNAWPYDMVVIDELTGFKSPKAARFKALRQVRPRIKRVVGLTGTPQPNGLLDLWSQVYLLDRGERLEKTVTAYRDKYFTINPYERFARYKIMRPDDKLIGEGYYEQEIYRKIADICFSMKAKDYIDLPELIFNDIVIPFSPASRKAYLSFEKKLVLDLADETEITAVNAAALSTKLLQFCNGAVYDADRNYHVVHEDKLAALEEIIEDANGKPVLVFYQFKHDADLIAKRLSKPGRKVLPLKGPESIDAWNRGEIDVMYSHPASGGHGLNLQYGGHIIVFYGRGWNYEFFAQAIKRLHRPDQASNVIVHILYMADSIDLETRQRGDGKEQGNNGCLSAVKALIRKYK